MEKNHNPILSQLNLKSLASIENYIKTIYLTKMERSFLHQALTLEDMVYLLYILQGEDIEITQVKSKNQLVISHRITENEDFEELRNFSENLYDFIRKSDENGFIITAQENMLDEILMMIETDKTSCIA